MKIEIAGANGQMILCEVIKLADGGAVGAFKCPSCPRIHVVVDPLQVGLAITPGGEKRVAGISLSQEEAEAFCDAVLSAAGFTPIKLTARPAGEVH